MLHNIKKNNRFYRFSSISMQHIFSYIFNMVNYDIHAILMPTTTGTMMDTITFVTSSIDDSVERRISTEPTWTTG